MRVSGRVWLVTGLATIAAAIAGCGGGGGGDAKSSPAKTQPSKPIVGSGSSLARPVYPTCAFPSFGKPKTTETKGPGGGKAWQVSYLVPGLTPKRAGQTTNVLIVEQSPKIQSNPVQGGARIEVAGRSVSLRRPTASSAVFVAAWKTKRARYIVLANGDKPATVYRFIGCLP